MSIAHLYKITRISTGEFYYGIHSGTDQNGYWGSGSIIKKFLKTHSTDELKYEILLIGEKDFILEVENKIVDINMIQNDLCWNLREGGYYGSYSEESRKRISDSKIGKKLSEKARNSVIKGLLKRDPGIYEKIGEKNRGQKRTKEQCDRISKAKLKNMNDEKRNNIAKAKEGSKNPSWRGYVKTPDGIFETYRSAAVYYNLTDCTIRNRCLNNKKFSDWILITDTKLVNVEDIMKVDKKYG